MCFEKRIDELGRFSIPIDIRKKLNIQANDYLNISCNDQTIFIEKKSFQNRFKDVIENILIKFKNIYDCDVFLFNKEKLLYTSNKEIENKNILVSNLSLEKYFDYPQVLVEHQIKIFDEFIFDIAHFIPIIESGYVIGIAIISSNQRISDYFLFFLHSLFNDEKTKENFLVYKTTNHN